MKVSPIREIGAAPDKSGDWSFYIFLLAPYETGDLARREAGEAPDKSGESPYFIGG